MEEFDPRKTYPVVLGDSLKKGKKGVVTIRYSFRSEAIGDSRPGSLVINPENSNAVLTFPDKTVSDEDVIFKGTSKEPKAAKPTDFMLIFDPDKQHFVLEAQAENVDVVISSRKGAATKPAPILTASKEELPKKEHKDLLGGSDSESDDDKGGRPDSPLPVSKVQNVSGNDHKESSDKRKAAPPGGAIQKKAKKVKKDKPTPAPAIQNPVPAPRGLSGRPQAQQPASSSDSSESGSGSSSSSDSDSGSSSGSSGSGSGSDSDSDSDSDAKERAKAVAAGKQPIGLRGLAAVVQPNLARRSNSSDSD